MSIQVVVITHENGIAAFRRHEKFWKAFDAPILVLNPKDDRTKYTHEKLSIGSSQRNGHDSITRLQSLFDSLSKSNWERCVIYEYDSFSLSCELPDGPGLFGIVFKDSECPKFISHRYVNPPWCFDRPTFDRLLLKSKDFPNIYEDGEADRWISALAFLAGVPIFDYSPPGFSRGTICSGDVSHLMHAVKEQRSIHFHGVKQDWVLRAIEQFYDEANPK